MREEQAERKRLSEERKRQEAEAAKRAEEGKTSDKETVENDYYKQTHDEYLADQERLKASEGHEKRYVEGIANNGDMVYPSKESKNKTWEIRFEPGAKSGIVVLNPDAHKRLLLNPSIAAGY
jgi:membrane carboxypeptidase/penicillin-binding protein